MFNAFILRRESYIVCYGPDTEKNKQTKHEWFDDLEFILVFTLIFDHHIELFILITVT